ncbi:hypothetical protein BH11ACT1_BH11ACT1_15440 [soil metagenome]
MTWDDPCPDEWVDQLAELETRMSTDAPGGGLDLHEDRWDADRVRATEAELRERGMRHSVAAAVHVPTGTLAAFSAFKRPAWTDEFVHQHDTLVLAEHRGRRLGMLVGTANLERLAAEQPDARRIGTWNAEENAHMLGINVALGFGRPAARASGRRGSANRAAAVLVHLRDSGRVNGQLHDGTDDEPGARGRVHGHTADSPDLDGQLDPPTLEADAHDRAS